MNLRRGAVKGNGEHKDWNGGGQSERKHYLARMGSDRGDVVEDRRSLQVPMQMMFEG